MQNPYAISKDKEKINNYGYMKLKTVNQANNNRYAVEVSYSILEDSNKINNYGYMQLKIVNQDKNILDHLQALTSLSADKAKISNSYIKPKLIKKEKSIISIKIY